MGWFIGIVAFIFLVIIRGLIPETEPKCKVCNDSKEVEALVMGTDTEMVECPYCSPKEEYKEFQKRYKEFNAYYQ